MLLKRGKTSELATPLVALFAFRQDGGDYLGGLFLTESLETTFQLWRTHGGKMSGNRMGVHCDHLQRPTFIKATVYSPVDHM